MEVKICGITSFEDAKKAVQEGAQYLGFILAKGQRRYLSDIMALEIIQKLQKYPVHLVGVFAEDNFQIIRQRAEKLGLEYVQIVAPPKKTSLSFLGSLKKFLVIPVNSDGSYTSPSYSLEKDDMWIYDSKSFGEGKTFNWDQFAKKEKGPFFIAGGLDPNNVHLACSKFNPNGLDVSSGVCNETKIEKDTALIKQFIQKAVIYKSQRHLI
jgi:phosphoribosylanthranilate isomerase